MKKILLATTMLAGFAGAASAEMALSGSAVMGVGGNGNDTYSLMETYVTFTGTGTTDGGLEFGLSSTMATYSSHGEKFMTDSVPDNTDPVDYITNFYGNSFADDGTSVYISGAFGKLSMGSVGEADDVAGLSDIGGIGGLGVDNVAEVFNGDSLGEAHNVNYTYTAGSFTVSASADIDQDGVYAVGGKYTFGDYYVGLGFGADDNDYEHTTSLYAGGTMGAVSVKAMYSSYNDYWNDDTYSAYGLYGAYTTGALTISAEVADNDYTPDASFGLGAAYDLGGGATVTGGIASINGGDLKWEAGVSMSF
jgi:outer membrane protein OmpU